MATANPFDLLGDNDIDDPNQLIAKLPAVAAAAAPATKKTPAGGVAAKPAAKLPSKPLPPAQAVREGRVDGQRGGGRFGGRGTGRGGRGYNRDSADNENSYGTDNGFSGGYKPSEDGFTEKSSERRAYGGPRGGFRGGRRGGYGNGDAEEGERPRRVFERRSGTGRGNEFKREGSGRGNWGTAIDEGALETEESAVTEKNVDAEKPAGEDDAADATKENPENKAEEKEPEDKEMTLEEYEKVLEEKRKALQALKAEERKVGLDKDLAKMQLLSNKKNEDEVFVKLGSDKDKRTEADKEERAKKSLSINEFLKPAEGERYYNPGGRGRGRGRGSGSGSRGGGYYNGGRMNDVAAPSIEDVGQFPSLGVK